MEVILDGHPNAALSASDGDLLTAIGAVNDALRAEGRGIVGMKLNGRHVTPQSIQAETEERSAAEAVVLEVETASLLTMARDILQEMLDVLPELPSACRALAQVFQGENPEAGFESFQELADVWSAVKERQSMILDSLDILAENVHLNGASLVEMHTELNQYLEESARALENRDYVLLGDLLEYELAPRAEMELEIVEQLLRRIEETATL